MICVKRESLGQRTHEASNGCFPSGKGDSVAAGSQGALRMGSRLAHATQARRVRGERRPGAERAQGRGQRVRREMRRDSLFTFAGVAVVLMISAS